MAFIEDPTTDSNPATRPNSSAEGNPAGGVGQGGPNPVDPSSLPPPPDGCTYGDRGQLLCEPGSLGDSKICISGTTGRLTRCSTPGAIDISVGSPFDLFNDLNSVLGGKGGKGGGGGSGGAGGSSSTTGTVGEAQTNDLAKFLADLLKGQGGDAPSFQLDPKFAEQFAALQQALQDSQGKLAELDPATLDAFQAQKKARLGDFEAEANKAQNDLLVRLFGSGVAQSTTAASQAGDFAASKARGADAITADIASQELQTRQFLTQSNLQNLQVQLDALNNEQQGALAELGIQADTVTKYRQQNVSLLSDLLGYQTQRDVAKTSADAQIKAAQIGARASTDAAKFGFISDLYRTQIGQQQFFLTYGQNEDQFTRQLNLDAELGFKASSQADRAARNAERQQQLATLAAIAIAAFSDRRLKHDIVFIGYLEDIPVYTFKYFGSNVRHIGTMAQDVLLSNPSAVSVESGAYVVNYALLRCSNAS